MGNALNYFYLEVCWQGYPLVHNAHLCADLGYYYEGNDVLAGCARLLEVFDRHDVQAAGYMARQRQLIARYLLTDSAVVAGYEALLARLMAAPLALGPAVSRQAAPSVA